MVRSTRLTPVGAQEVAFDVGDISGGGTSVGNDIDTIAAKAAERDCFCASAGAPGSACDHGRVRALDARDNAGEEVGLVEGGTTAGEEEE